MLTEERCPPGFHQFGRVAVVGVEVGPLVVLEPAPQGGVHDRGALQPLPAPAKVAPAVGGAVTEQRGDDRRRLLAGLEPEVTVRVLDIPALTELRKACTELLRNGQADGTVRPDIDPALVGNGIIALMLSVLMSVTQLGSQTAVAYSHDVAAVFEAALTSPARGRGYGPD